MPREKKQQALIKYSVSTTSDSSHAPSKRFYHSEGGDRQETNHSLKFTKLEEYVNHAQLCLTQDQRSQSFSILSAPHRFVHGATLLKPNSTIIINPSDCPQSLLW